MQLYNNIIILVLKSLHNFNVVDICLTAEQIEGDHQGALGHHIVHSIMHFIMHSTDNRAKYHIIS